MLKLQSPLEIKKYALLLNHRQLIDDAYNVKGAISEEAYELKAELFQFQPKNTHEHECRLRKKRKRKASEPEHDDALAIDAASSPKESETVKQYLSLLPAAKYTTSSSLPRYWEESYSLPQLHGANASGRFQKFQHNKNTYLIPHAASFFNHNVSQLPALLPQLLPSYDLIILDPPWRNKYIRRVKRARQTLGYAMLDNDQLRLLPLEKLINRHTLVAIWCTNAAQHQTALETQLLPHWQLRLLHKLRWYKLNTAHQLIGPLTEDTQKQPYELLYLACHVESEAKYAASVKEVELLLSIPSIIHSHKPPLLAWLRKLWYGQQLTAEPSCLELFARYVQPQCTSIGLEVLKLMDARLYTQKCEHT